MLDEGYKEHVISNNPVTYNDSCHSAGRKKANAYIKVKVKTKLQTTGIDVQYLVINTGTTSFLGCRRRKSPLGWTDGEV